tara:strand:+ start:1244 stop:1603 length:360 start_codon:yes stop_codon:yes gene_type:complete
MSVQNERFRDYEQTYSYAYATTGAAILPTDINPSSSVFNSARPQLTQLTNVGTEPVYVKLGSAATTSSGGFSYILAGCTIANDGTGARLDIEGYTGFFSIVGDTGVAGKINFTRSGGGV